METSKSRRHARSNAKTAPLGRATPAGASRRAGTSKLAAAWITDPGALLDALASAERAEQDAKAARERAEREEMERRARAAAEAEGEAATVAEVAPEREAPTLIALPSLREDERIGRQSGEGVVVIIRRRRAA